MRRVGSDWRVLVPIKQGQESKSRLGSMLEDDARSCLAGRMAEHVLSVLEQVFPIEATTILSPRKPASWQGGWGQDHGRGLNDELTHWRGLQGAAPVMIIHADLPLLSADDVRALLRAAEKGAALATDRMGLGTNALAIADGRSFVFRFGPDSRKLHCAQYPEMPVLQREGLMADLDTPDDAEFVRMRGFRL